MPFVETLDPADVEQLPEEKQGHGALKTDQGNLPLKQMDVDTKIAGLLCKTTLRQTFVNATGKPLEATYIFPLPDRAGVTRFRMEVGERVIEGDLQERAQARKNYSQAIATGYRAAIAEEERPDVFTMRAGNILPGEEVTIWLDMAGPLETSAGCATFRFPLVVAPRYIPGMPYVGAPNVGTGTSQDTDQVPDASRITPPTLLAGHKSPVQLNLKVTFDPAGLNTSRVRTSMPVEEGLEGDVRTIQLRPGQRLDQDFVLRFDFLSSDLQATLVIERDAPGSTEGTLLMTVVGPDQREVFPPKDVVFVLDRSGSMQGWKMVAARRACSDLIDNLGPRDRFDVLAFDTSVERPFMESGMRQATPHNRYVAVEWLSRIDARGGTEIPRPLFAAMQNMPPLPEREQTIVLITDGQVGNDRAILKIVQDNLGGAQGRRIHTLGIDRAVSAGFLKGLADAGGGRCELVESPERLTEVLDSFAKQICGPYLEDMAFVVDGLKVDVSSVAPSTGHHLYPNVPTLVMARFTGLEREAALLTGSIAGVVPKIAGSEVTDGILTPAWARGRIRELEDDWASCHGAEGEEEIVALSLKHKVMSRFTAFVAIDRSAVVNPGGEQVQVTQPVEQPAGWGGGQSMSSALYAAPHGGMGVVRGMGMGGVVMGQSYGAGGQSVGGGGAFCSAVGGAAVNYYGHVETSAQDNLGGAQGFSGFAPGFDPMGRRGKIPTHRSRSGGMRVVPIPAVSMLPTDQHRQAALDLVNEILKGKKKGKKFWGKMDDLSKWLSWLTGSGEQMVDGSLAVSPVLRSALNTAIAAQKWTPRTQQVLETIKSELERTLDPVQRTQPRPVNDAFWKR